MERLTLISIPSQLPFPAGRDLLRGIESLLGDREIRRAAAGCTHFSRTAMCARAMTLDDYRLQLLQRIRDCASVENVRELVTEAQIILSQNPLTERTLRMFWSALRADLDVLSEELIHTPESAGRATRGTILNAAQVAVTLCQNELTWAPSASDAKP